MRRAEPGEPTVLKDMFSRSFLAVERPGVAMSAPPSQPVRRCGRITTSGVPKMVVSPVRVLKQAYFQYYFVK